MKRFCACCLILLTAVSLLAACAKKEENKPVVTVPSVISDKITGSEKWQNAVAYDEEHNWLALDKQPKKRADVIFFYPDIYVAGEGENEVCAIDNASMREKAAGLLSTRAAVFTDECNLYAPYYRQIDRSFMLSLNPSERETVYKYAASKDAASALDYYFENLNDGRPFILAGHGQGSDIVRRIVADYLPKHPEYRERLIAAYAIGCAVTDTFVREYGLKFASKADDLGVIVSYNTEGQDNYDYDNAYTENHHTLVINPVSWTTKARETTSAKYHLGMLEDDGTIVEHPFGTHINEKHGTVICEDNEIAERYSKTEDTDLYGPRCCHDYDYQFFFMNLKENVKTRVDAYFGS